MLYPIIFVCEFSCGDIWNVEPAGGYYDTSLIVSLYLILRTYLQMRRHGGEGICKLSTQAGDAVGIGWPMHRYKSNIKRDHDADIVQTSWDIEISVLYRVEKSQGDLLWEQSVIYLGLTFRLGYNCIPTKIGDMLRRRCVRFGLVQ